MLRIMIIGIGVGVAVSGWEERRASSDGGACAPCHSSSSSTPPTTSQQSHHYRGNGADNLGYDWSPKAWGGPAFPPQPPGDSWRERGAKMLHNANCIKCTFGKSMYADQFAHTTNDATDNSQSVSESYIMTGTVTSPVLGIRLRDDKRLPVEWQWNEFRNRLLSDEMERRDGSDSRVERPWGVYNEPSLSSTGDGKGRYAENWNYRGNLERPDSKYSWHRGRDPDRSTEETPPYNFLHVKDADAKPFYDRHHSSSGKDYQYPNTQYEYPYSQPLRPSYSSNGPATTNSQPLRPSYPSNGPTTTSQAGGNAWTAYPEIYVHRPNQNYLPSSQGQSGPPPAEYPHNGKPGTMIWHGAEVENHRPNQPGYYTAFITELNDPNYKRPTSPNRPYYGEAPGHHPPHYGNQNVPELYNKDKHQSGNSIQQGGYYYGTDKPLYVDNGDYIKRPVYANENSWGSSSSDYRRPEKRPNYGNIDRYPNYNSNKYHYLGDREKNENRYPYDPTDPSSYPSYNDNRNANRYPAAHPDRAPLPSPGNQYLYGTRNDLPSYLGNSGRYPDTPVNVPSYTAGGERPFTRPSSSSDNHSSGSSHSSDTASWNYGDENGKNGNYRRSGGSYPPYKGGQVYTSSYLASASTPAPVIQDTTQTSKEN